MCGSRNSLRRPRPLRIFSLARFAARVLFFASAAFLNAEKFDFSGDATTMTLAEGGQHALLTGHGRVESQDLRITADSIELFGKDFIYARCHGNVHVVDARRGLDLSSQELFYDRDRKIAQIRGNAMMADVKNEMVVKGGFIEDRDTEQITIVQIGVRIFKKDIVCRSEFARYLRDKKILELSGTPWVSKGGDVYQAARITINLDTEDITLEGSVQGTLEDKGKSTQDNTGAAPDSTTGQGRRPRVRSRQGDRAVTAEGTLFLEGLGKTFGRVQAVREVTFRMESGEVVGLLGPNGAGKTTVFYMVVGFIHPSAGRIWLNGKDISGLPMYSRARLGVSYLPQEPSIFRKLTVEDNILAILETRSGLTSRERQVHLDKLLEDLGIRALRKQKAYTLSGGERRRTEIARSLAIEPKFLLLDEPFAGIDPITVSELKTIVQGLSERGIGVLITDHNVRDTLQITHRSHIINRGEILVSGTREELLASEVARSTYLGHEFEI